jgi:molybdopterin-biosynthesis enzyme MoeA-like protein
VNVDSIILCFSREILEGAVVDRNAAFMAARMTDLGLHVKAILVVGRAEREIVDALQWALHQKPAFTLATGALGTAVDDNARAGLAKAIGVELKQSPEAMTLISSSCRRLHAKGLIDDAEAIADRCGAAMVPPGSKCFENPIGSSPGVELTVGGTKVFLLPGVPAELQAMFSRHVLPKLMAKGPTTLRKHRIVDCDGADDSTLSQILGTFARQHPGVAVRTRTVGCERDAVTQITLQAEHPDAAGLDDLLERAELDLRSLLGVQTGQGE